MPSHHPTLATNLAGLELASPLILAAGTAGYVDELDGVTDLSASGGVGAVVTKSITRDSREGNATWRIIEHKAGMLNAIGLANVGLDAFGRDVVPSIDAFVRRGGAKVIGSISGFSIDEFVAVAAAMDAVEAIPAVELNVSCPNVKHGCEFGSDPALLSELVREVRRVLTRTRLFVKVSPTVIGLRTGASKDSTRNYRGEGVVAVCEASIESGAQPNGPNQRLGADAMVIANTMPAMAIDVHTRKPRLSRGSGGLSGPAIHPIAVKLVHDAYTGICRETKTPIIGLGGVTGWDDAAEFILAGASAVAIGTTLFADPRAPKRIAKGLDAWVREQRKHNIAELVGAVELA